MRVAQRSVDRQPSAALVLAVTEVPAPEGTPEREEERATALTIERVLALTSLFVMFCAWSLGGWRMLVLMLVQGIAWQAMASVYLITFPGNATAVRRLLEAIERRGEDE